MNSTNFRTKHEFEFEGRLFVAHVDNLLDDDGNHHRELDHISDEYGEWVEPGEGVDDEANEFADRLFEYFFITYTPE